MTLTTTFRDLGILPETAEALEAVGITTPFPIQEMTLPVALSGSDVIGQAKTGTGKTLGFGLPLLERVVVPADVQAGRAAPEDLSDAPQALVVVPTRELCVQVTNDLLTAGKVRNVRVAAIYGGRAYEPQVEALQKGVDVVVGTPGRLLDLAGQKKLDLRHVKCLVLDEADEMLDLGFLPDVEKIMDMLPAERQTMLFSATMPGAVIGLARRYMSQPTHIRATAPDDEGVTVANIKQFVYRAHSLDKPEMIARILQAEGRGLAMIFCRTKRTAADIAEQLQRRGFAAGAVHGDLGQGAREQALRAFRNGKVDVLVCTDVAARGIDVEGVTHVINYQCPEDEKTYLHRIGRTGRAGAKGTAITLVDWDDVPRWQLINKTLELDFHEPVETYSTSPHLFSDLGIPEGTKGILPRSQRTRAGLDAEELEDLGETGGRGRGGRGGRDRSRSAGRDRERPARTPRRRRRTRGGAPVDAAPAAGTAGEAASAEATGTDEQPRTRTPRRRRRMRGGVPVEAAAPAPAASAPAPEASQEVPAPQPEPAEPAAPSTASATAVAEAPAAEAAPEAPAKPRRRTRRTAEAATPETTAPEAEQAPKQETGAPVAADTADAVGAEPKRTRTRKKAAAAPATDTATPATEEAEAKPKRTRKKAATTAPADTATTKAAPEAPATTDTTDATEAKPKRTRTRKKAAAAPTTDTATPATEEAEAKPKRTRKKAATTAPADTATTKAAPEAPATTDTTDATEAKPKRTRTRKKAAAAPTTDTATPATEEAEAKPKRTRKKATTTAPEAVDAADGAEAPTAEANPRRRTRKAAASAAGAEIPAQATGEAEDGTKPRTRRTRKTAAAVESADA
ncbi:DEAD/DEAH box helicase [Streptomyces thermoviolaceus]|uniref:RNA helicase n=4 Tax=Streptomyces TaxID=1883 RepID=A0ABX0YVM3_STRTL|nr:DEAD/DEAH box helicase [Streptomyces thermoviolaceus]NJP15165.1 DEAD/DEAH box helicase [Streptomyces thermoviolaceus subsp. thermoviolaceus]